MKPDQLPVCTNEAIQNKLVQAQREMKMLQTSSVQVSSMSSTSFQRVETSSSSSSQVSRSHHQVCENSEAKSFASNFNGNYLSSSFSSEGKSDVCNISEVTNSSLTNGHRNGTLSSNDSLENVISKGTETVRALTDAINRDDQRFSLPREDRRSAAKEIPSQNQNNIAGSYFQSKYGANNNTEKTCTTIEQKRVSQINSRARSVGAATPDRESRGPSFSYLSLLPADGSFPHRTQPIGGPQTSRKSSCTLSRAPSIERNERSGSEKPNLMVRTNPIGLAEPSVKRDGYAVGKDGSFYRSSENLFSNPPSRSCSRASSETPEVRTGRRQSDTGIRLGGGLVETGRPVVQHFSTPFGSTVTGKTKNYTVKKGTSSSTSTTRKSEKKISTSTQHINQIKTESSSSMMTSSTMTKHENMTSSTRSEEVVNCTLNLNRGRHRSQSSTRSTVTTLPDHDVTISLPGSLRASVDRDVVIPDSRLSRANRSSSMEIFNGVYEVKVPLTQTSSKKSKVEEIYTDHVILRGANGSNHAINGEVETSEAPHAEIILTGIPLHRTALVKPDAVRKPREPVNNSVSLMKHNNYATNSMTQNHNTTSQFTQHHNSAFCAVTQKSSTLNTSVIQSNTINTVTKNQNTVSASTQSFNTANAYSQNSKVSSGFSTHSSTAQSTIQNFSTSSTTTESSSVATSLASSKLVLAQEMKMEQIKQEKPELQQIEDKKEFSTKLTNGFALHNVQSNSMSQTGEQKRIEAKIEIEKKDEKKRLEQREDVHSSRETIISGQKFNISSSLKKTSKLSSREDLRETINVTTSSRSAQIGGHLKGLDLALEALAHKQQQEKNQCQQQHTKVTNGDGDVTNVTVSLPASRRTSRRGSVDLTAQPLRRSRRNSIDLFSAEYDIKLSSGRSGVATPLSMEQKNVCHIRIDDRANSSLKLCPRCHGVGHLVENCTEFGNLSCPRCLEWNHWEDSCPSCDAICPSCQSPGHLPIVHSASDYKQRRAVVDTLGWELMRDWFFEAGFRSWWQLNGCVGVPLYKIYPRKNQWRSEGPIIDPGLEGKSVDSNMDNNCTNVGTLPLEERAAVLAEKYSSTYKVKRDTSIDDLLKSFNESKLKRAAAVTEAKTQDNNDDDNDSGRSTPEYLKKYSVNYHFSQKNNNNNSNSTTTANSNDNNNEDSISISNTTNQTDTASKRRLRTFSETLKMLDDDILAELDMK